MNLHITLDLVAIAERFEAEFDGLLRMLPDCALVEVLDQTESHTLADEEAKELIAAGVTAMFVRRIRVERDRRLHGMNTECEVGETTHKASGVEQTHDACTDKANNRRIDGSDTSY